MKEHVENENKLPILIFPEGEYTWYIHCFSFYYNRTFSEYNFACL